MGEPIFACYERASRRPSACILADAADAADAERIEASREDSRRTYGAPRVHAIHDRERAHTGKWPVARLMADSRWQDTRLRWHWAAIRQDSNVRFAPDLVERTAVAAPGPKRL